LGIFDLTVVVVREKEGMSEIIFNDNERNNLDFNLCVAFQFSIAMLVTNFEVIESSEYELKKKYIRRE